MIIKTYEKAFLKDSGITIAFEESALDRLLEMVLCKDIPVNVLCESMFKSYHHGLNLIREKNGKDTFILTREAIEDPEGYLEKLIRESYGT